MNEILAEKMWLFWKNSSFKKVAVLKWWLWWKSGCYVKLATLKSCLPFWRSSFSKSVAVLKKSIHIWEGALSFKKKVGCICASNWWFVLVCYIARCWLEPFHFGFSRKPWKRELQKVNRIYFQLLFRQN